MIDIRAFKQLIAGYRQYFIYKKKHNFYLD